MSLLHRSGPDSARRTPPALLRCDGSKVVPEVLAFGLEPPPSGAASPFVRAFDEAGKGLCGAAGAGLQGLTDLGGVDACLRREFGFCYLNQGVSPPLAGIQLR